MAARRILLVEPDPLTAAGLNEKLSSNGYGVATATTGEEVLAALALAPSDLILLSVKLPDVNGVALIPQIRHRSNLPIIVYSDHYQQGDVVPALKLGADDIVPRSIGIDELVARIEAVLRRATYKRIDSDDDASPELTEGLLTLHKTRKTVTYDGRRVHLTPTEFLILQELLRHKHEPVKREDIFTAVWGGIATVSMLRNVDVHLNRMCSRLSVVGANRHSWLRTLKNVGWMIKAEPDAMVSANDLA